MTVTEVPLSVAPLTGPRLCGTRNVSVVQSLRGASPPVWWLGARWLGARRLFEVGRFTRTRVGNVRRVYNETSECDGLYGQEISERLAIQS